VSYQEQMRDALAVILAVEEELTPSLAAVLALIREDLVRVTQPEQIRERVQARFRDARLDEAMRLGIAAAIAAINEDLDPEQVRAAYDQLLFGQRIWDIVAETTWDQLTRVFHHLMGGFIAWEDWLAEQERWLGPERARGIARTEGTRVASAISLLLGQLAGRSTWIWVARLDDRTCSICMQRHGNRYTIWDPKPPAHTNCRCVVLWEES
jgi:SPP1 gp7 family putative phage head morphogenesis protein